ncbi:MAG: hypothetical protein GTN62_10850 [Gemmatimonadales bacterium]|nr:hypothetical protein [Gemmatimonadales bacterium]NIN12172.1 hypothetical protein [Gemmatimonadales bacterium]NIN50593.1 hypothetical protein [Gemmatimonadales bacterium]NIP08057.1 hypothetical protein [Gemmatimonadales bacterium]NIR00639.1 hypothetical protein [Gemmatimonadales bacterium]
MGGRSGVDARRASITRLFTVVSVILLSTTFSPSVDFQRPHDLIVVQVSAEAKPEYQEEKRLHTPMDRYVDGTRIVLLPASGAEPVVLTPEFAAACDPDVSFDGKTILFAGKKSPDDSWQIWRMNADGSEKVQITSGQDHSIAPVFAGNRFYLNDSQPTPQIIYTGTAHGWKNEQASGPALALYGTDLEGRTVRRLTFNLHSDFAPDVLPSGRIVFTSWQHYGDRHQPDGLFALMGVNIDGTDLMPFYGNHEPPPYKGMVHASDFDDRVYFVESDRSTWLGGGDIAYVSRRRPLHSYRQLSHDPEGLFHSPCPLPDGGLIASYRPEAPDAVFGVYRIDPESGRRQEKIFEEAGWHSIDAQVLASHPTVPGRSNWLIPGSTTGVFYSLNSYRSDLAEGDDIASGTIKHVRVIEGIPLRERATLSQYQHEDRQNPGLEPYSASAFGARRLLGVGPVEEDGSFHIRVPAEIPITFQLLDENYLALRTQRAWTWVMGNENRGCIGCHENRELSPPNRMVAAVIKPPVELTLPPARRRTVDFRHNIAPIIESKCATGGCHVAAHAEPNLATVVRRRTPTSAFDSAYQTLLGPIKGRSAERYLVPGNARESPLIWLLFGKKMASGQTPYTRDITRMASHNVLQPRERILFIEWIDLGAQWDSRAATTVDPPLEDS